jgi:hypothetical protein
MKAGLVFERAVVKRIAMLIMPMLRKARISLVEMERIRVMLS